MQFKAKPQHFLILILSIIGAWLLAYSMDLGPYINSDSVEYYEVARNLSRGSGLVVRKASGELIPLNLRPPFYPMVMSIAASLGWDMVTFNYWLNIGLFTILLIVMGLRLDTLTKKPLLSILIILVFVTSPTPYLVYSGALSEPLYFTLGLSGLFLLAFYTQNGNRPALVFSAILSGLAFLTRFNGLAFVAAGALSLIAFSSKPLKNRLKDTLLFGLLGVLPALVWVSGVFLQDYTPGGYQLPFADLWEYLAPVRGKLVNVAWKWTPFPVLFRDTKYLEKFIILAIMFILVVTLLIVVVRKLRSRSPSSWRRDPSLQIVGILIFFIVAFMTIHFGSYLVVKYPKPGLNERSFSPIQFGSIVSVLIILYLFSEKMFSGRLSQLFPVIIVGWSVISQIPALTDRVSSLHNEGKVYSNPRWRTSALIQQVNQIAEEIPIISNQAPAIYFFLDRPAYDIPELSREEPLLEYHRFGDDMQDEIQWVFRQDGAALVLFDTAYWEFWPLYGDDTQTRLDKFTEGLYLGFEGVDGEIYYYREPQDAETK